MSTDSDKTGLAYLLSHANEFVKQYIELDGEGRTAKVFTAKHSEKVDGPCAVTAYAYSGPTSTVVIARKEGSSQWTQAMEDAQPTL